MIDYSVRKSLRAKHMRITVRKDGTVVVTIPKRGTELAASKFVEEKRKWIENTLARVHARREKQEELNIPKGSVHALKKNKTRALELIKAKLEHFNAFYGLVWKRVSVKHLTTRWGSCSKIGNLNFSYKIIYLPEELANYLVVHELCHLGAFDHSRRFWNLVAQTVPDYKELRARLRNIE